ncbi:DUF6475 domain-containing protein [Massilia pseudoviolaceinigra]|uniref:DUF6475 domain-containing protein n=1 Tax=Massilia pseudoviolaceinigra TaxID=3057165 RepID=UPI0027969112|nr:DUF6475 domain-containing protein [Massilia sp. CCM 9206]MDQ1921653.1 DUF6475 domain-containing protein [Massilia sp. CCM 9206]
MTETPEEKKRFASLIVGISDYYRREISKMAIQIYWEGLRQFDYESIERAMWQHTQSTDEAGKWMPQISDLKIMMHGRTHDQAALAWSKVNMAVRQVGPIVDVVFDDALVHRVIADMGGWAALGLKEEKEWPFIAKEFENRYRGYKMSDQKPEYPKTLIGMANAHNGASGLAIQGPRLVGNRELCLQVLRGQALGLGNATRQLEGPQ